MGAPHSTDLDIGPAFDGRAQGFDRRQLLRAGAWAAPVILLATSVPAAVASMTERPPTDQFADHFVAYVPDAQLHHYNSDRFQLNDFRVTAKHTPLVGTVTVVLSPAEMTNWTILWDNVDRTALACEDGKWTAQFTLADQWKQLQTAFRLVYRGGSIPAGTYTAQIAYSFMQDGRSVFVQYPLQITVP